MGTRIDHRDQPTHQSPSGLPIRHLVSGDIDSSDLYVGEQWLQPGEEVLLHTHQVEEVLIFTAGTGTAWLGEDTFAVEAGISLHIPAGEIHGFRNTGQSELRLFVIFPGNQFASTEIVEP